MPTFVIKIVYKGGKEPLTDETLPTEEERVMIEAEALQQARRRVMAYNTINPRGRLVRFFDELGNELFDGRF